MEFYEAKPTKLNSDNEQNVKMINDWVADKTKNKIKQLVESVDSYNQLMLVNAVYFVGQCPLNVFVCKPFCFPLNASHI